MRLDRPIALSLSLLMVFGVASCTESDSGGPEPETRIVPTIEPGAPDAASTEPALGVADLDDASPAPAVSSTLPAPAADPAPPAADPPPAPAAAATPPPRRVSPPHEEDPIFTGTWEGHWNGRWRVLFEFGPQRENGEMDVVYRWEELPGRPMNTRNYVGYFSHGDVHLESLPDGRRKTTITLIKIKQRGETSIYAVGKFGNVRMTHLSRLPAAAEEE